LELYGFEKKLPDEPSLDAECLVFYEEEAGEVDDVLGEEEVLEDAGFVGFEVEEGGNCPACEYV